MPTPFVGSSEAQGSGLSLSDTGDHTRPLANRLALAREVSSNDGTLFILLRHRAYRGLHRFRSRCRIGCADPNATCGPQSILRTFARNLPASPSRVFCR